MYCYYSLNRLASQNEEENIEDLVTASFNNPETIGNPDSSGSSFRHEVTTEKSIIPIRSPDDEFVEAYDDVREKFTLKESSNKIKSNKILHEK